MQNALCLEHLILAQGYHSKSHSHDPNERGEKATEDHVIFGLISLTKYGLSQTAAFYTNVILACFSLA